MDLSNALAALKAIAQSNRSIPDTEKTAALMLRTALLGASRACVHTAVPQFESLDCHDFVPQRQPLVLIYPDSLTTYWCCWHPPSGLHCARVLSLEKSASPLPIACQQPHAMFARVFVSCRCISDVTTVGITCS